MDYVIIINSFKWHNSLAYACLERNLFPIHISSSIERFRQTMIGVQSHYFFSFHIYQSIEQIHQELKPFLRNIKFVFSCDEHGQMLKDILDEILELGNGNSKTNALARYSKFELFKKLNYPCSKTKFKNFIDDNGPSIIKPDLIEYSGGNINVSFHKTSKEDINEEGNYFISKFFKGEEFQVDLVSSHGNHQFVSVWKMLLTDEVGLWRYGAVHLPYEYDRDFMAKMYKACTNWLDILDHKFGPVHMDVRFDGENFYCIEINFRLAGCVYYPMLKKNWGAKNQVDLTIDAYCHPHKFLDDLDIYKTNSFMTCTFLPNYAQRNFNQVDWKKIETAPSVGIIFYLCWKGQDLPICQNNIQTTSAIANLLNHDKTQLIKDWENLLTIFNNTPSPKINF